MLGGRDKSQAKGTESVQLKMHNSCSFPSSAIHHFCFFHFLFLPINFYIFGSGARMEMIENHENHVTQKGRATQMIVGLVAILRLLSSSKFAKASDIG